MIKELLIHQASLYFTSKICHSFMCCLVQQAVEKIDRMRECAGKILMNVLHAEPALPHIPRHAELKEILPAFVLDFVNVNMFRNLEINWTNATTVFPLMIKLINFEEYRENLLLGLCPSIGGVTSAMVHKLLQSFNCDRCSMVVMSCWSM